MTWMRELNRGAATREAISALGFPLSEGEFRETTAALDARIPEAFHRGRALENPGLANQVVPSTQELVFLPEELDDPIGDGLKSPLPGLTHRYPDRALLQVTYRCAVYCRFCFRRTKVSHPEHSLGLGRLAPSFAYLRQHPEIREVILTGGDPLVLSDRALGRILCELKDIPSVRWIRIHTRVPTALPSRVTPGLLETLAAAGKTVWIAAHVNHPAELTDQAVRALGLLRSKGFPLVSQSVYLRGVNGSAEVLTDLFTALTGHGVKPYFLHAPDLAKGTGHFRAPLPEIIGTYQALRGRVSSLAIPQLVLDIPGGHGKVPLDSGWLRESAGTLEAKSPLTGQWLVLPGSAPQNCQEG